jgi:hypothetical protein
MVDKHILFCFDVYYPNIGGGEFYYQKIAEAAVAAGNRATLVTTHTHADSPSHEFHNGVDIYRVKTPARILFALLALPLMWRLSRSADLIHTSTFAAAFPSYLVGKIRRKPTVIKGSALKAVEGDAKAEEAIMELMNKVDEYIPTPTRDLDKPFLMPVEDVFSIKGRGTVVTGRVERGVVKVNDTIEIVGIKATSSTVVTGVEMFRKQLDQGQAGDNVGILLRGVEKDQVERGQVLAKPGSVTPHTEFEAEVYILKKEEGGRHTSFVTGYRPQFYIRTTDVTGEVTLAQGVEMVMPGDSAKMKIKLIVPVALEEGLRFAIREGGKTVGAGAVTKIIS